ncbi:hypothetical protein LPJ64_002159 [Coemansia asiatica]|uniref:NADP-dependent oxidoreductase domain-containing protein n=1 Tax=Coemansia asiatica TaxID=1052880 RepID=A0A9W7XP86_9FUNG|nr:hypothetical protein LPJ64_002159 [Coemansia asiatica]
MVVSEITHSDRLPLSKLALGCGVFSGAYGALTEQSILASVRKALSSGINLLDTSPYYNDSEIKLGQALHALRNEFPRSSYHICTKVGRYGYHKADFDYSPEHVVMSTRESMRRLETDYLDIVLCHDVEFVSIEQVVDQALPMLFELKCQGIVRKVGISGYPLDVLLEIARIQKSREQPLDVCLSYCNFNLHCHLLAEYIQKLRSAGVTTIISASPLSMGLLSQEMTPDWHPAKEELKKAVSQCIEVVERAGNKVGLAEMAEHFSFSFTDADVHLVGAKTDKEVCHALEAFEQAIQMKLAGGGRYPDSDTQAVYEKIQYLLKPFNRYTWPSPPADA